MQIERDIPQPPNNHVSVTFSSLPNLSDLITTGRFGYQNGVSGLLTGSLYGFPKKEFSLNRSALPIIEPPNESPKKVPSSSRIRACYTTSKETQTSQTLGGEHSSRSMNQAQTKIKKTQTCLYPGSITIHIDAIACKSATNHFHKIRHKIQGFQA